MIAELILHLHKSGEKLEKSIIVFIPTYKMIESAYTTLSSLLNSQTGSAWNSVDIQVMHSSVDVEKCVQECIHASEFNRSAV